MNDPSLDTHLDLTLIERVRRATHEDDLTWHRHTLPVHRDHSPSPPAPPPEVRSADVRAAEPRGPARRPRASWTPVAVLVAALGALGAAASILGGAVVAGLGGVLPPLTAAGLALGALLLGFGAGMVAVVAWTHRPRRGGADQGSR